MSKKVVPKAPITLRKLQRSIAQALVSDQTEITHLIRQVAPLTSLERLNIYRRNTTYTLQHCLEKTFELTRSLLGPKHFVGLCRAYISQHSSLSSSLDEYGAEFPKVLRRRASALGIGSRASTIALQAAQLDWAIAQAERAALVPASKVARLNSLPPARQRKLCLRCAPSLRLLRISYALDLLASQKLSAQGRARNSPVKLRALRQPVTLAISMQRSGLRLRRVSQQQMQILTLLAKKPRTLGELVVYASRHAIALDRELPVLLENGEVF